MNLQGKSVVKKTIFAATVMAAVAALPGEARAVELNPDGLGQVLIFPYYTVNADNSTLLSVVNTRGLAKVVRVAFLEGYNGQEVLSLRLFLSAYDVWTANVFALTGNGVANVLTDDESCTSPDIKGATGPGIAQLPAPDGRSYLPARTSQLQTDGGPNGDGRTREGSIEVIELATIARGSAVETAVSHVNGVPPNGCVGISGVVNADGAALTRPTGGLFGSANIVNPGLGTLIGYNADAIDGFYLLNNSLYFGTGDASLADARTDAVSATAYNYAATAVDGPNELITSTYTATNAIDAVSSIFTASALVNEYVVEANSASESEWVVSFPTKKFYVNTGTTGIAPFVKRFAAPGISCVRVGVEYLDREQRLVRYAGDAFLGVPGPALCFQTQVVSLRTFADYIANLNVSAVLGSRLTSNFDPRESGFSSGWMRLDLNGIDPDALTGEAHALRPSIDLDIFQGLPATGFLATNYLNRNNGGPNVLSTYSTGARHRVQRQCVNATQGGTGFCS